VQQVGCRHHHALGHPGGARRVLQERERVGADLGPPPHLSVLHVHGVRDHDRHRRQGRRRRRAHGEHGRDHLDGADRRSARVDADRREARPLLAPSRRKHGHCHDTRELTGQERHHELESRRVQQDRSAADLDALAEPDRDRARAGFQRGVRQNVRLALPVAQERIRRDVAMGGGPTRHQIDQARERGHGNSLQDGVSRAATSAGARSLGSPPARPARRMVER
jgi:hypothetical protein